MNDNFLDIITLISFVIALQNLEMNISQTDLQEGAEKLDKSLRRNVNDIHKHLEEQDAKIQQILEVLNGDF